MKKTLLLLCVGLLSTAVLPAQDSKTTKQPPKKAVSKKSTTKNGTSKTVPLKKESAKTEKKQ